MRPYAELLEFNQPNPIRKPGFTRIRDQFPGLRFMIGDPYDPANPEFGREFASPERIMEFAGRWDYGPNNARKLGEMSSVQVRADNGMPLFAEGKPRMKEVPIIQKYISMGHESMIEMGDATFFIECSRVVSHELVRHRIASYQQESQRFVKYEDDFDVYMPDEIDGTDEAHELLDLHRVYVDLLKRGVSKQIARYVLPNAMRTRLIMKTNAREWRHIIRLRADKSAQPEMRELTLQIHDQLIDIFPNAMKGVLEGERGIR